MEKAILHSDLYQHFGVSLDHRKVNTISVSEYCNVVLEISVSENHKTHFRINFRKNRFSKSIAYHVIFDKNLLVFPKNKLKFQELEKIMLEIIFKKITEHPTLRMQCLFKKEKLFQRL